MSPSRPGVSSQQLVRAIAPLLPATAQVRTRAEQAQTSTNDVNQALAIVRYVLLAFGGIALFVGSFVIFNTLSVTVAQRTREFATLRTLGASRKQVLGSVVVEGSGDRRAGVADRPVRGARLWRRGCSRCSPRAACSSRTPGPCSRPGR